MFCSLRRSLVSALGLSLATGLVLSACAMEDDEDIWMPPSADGKADGIQLLHGSDIPSQFVTASKDYLSSRQIQTLVDVGTLTGTDLALARRADGIIANLPANGKIEAAELARMESNVIFPTLFPEEKAALPHLWDMMEVASGNAQSVPLAAADLTVTPALEEPGGLTVPASLQISSLDPAWQTVARRVELVFNHDNNANTIQIDDINHVLSDPQAFTPAEVEQLKAIVVEFNRRATSVEHARAKVPAPGQTAKHTALGQAMSLDFTANVSLTEHRQAYVYGFSANLLLHLETHGKFNQGVSDKAVWIDVDTGEERKYLGAQSELSGIGAGTWIVERYDQMGVRKETHKLALPAFNPVTTQTDETQYLDYDLETTAGDPMYKIAVSATQSQWAIVDFSWSTTNTPNTNVNQTLLDTVATPASFLPPGRYQLPYAALVIDIYPEGVILASNNSGPVRLNQSADTTGRYVANNVNGYGVTFRPQNGALVTSWGSMTMTPAQRVK